MATEQELKELIENTEGFNGDSLATAKLYAGVLEAMVEQSGYTIPDSYKVF
jgi:hypothetical protein